ncbi:MAG: hypothetical protein LC777_01425 [Actinobacteria bacterium]|nr:hypothetical protein [Actinomycetota bacterium]
MPAERDPREPGRRRLPGRRFTFGIDRVRGQIAAVETALYLLVGRLALTNFLLELGLLYVLVIAFALSIYLIRRGSAARRAADALPPAPPPSAA